MSLQWARLEKELKEGSTAWVTAIKHFNMKLIDSDSEVSLFFLLFLSFKKKKKYLLDDHLTLS